MPKPVSVIGFSKSLARLLNNKYLRLFSFCYSHAMTQSDAQAAIATHGVTRRHKVNSIVEERVEDIRRNGFTIIEGALTQVEARNASALLDRLYEQQVAEIGGEKRLQEINDQNIVRSVLVYEHAFLHLAYNPQLITIIKAILGDNISLSSQVGILNRPTQPNYQERWHRELQYQHFVISKPLAVQALYALDAFTHENGGTFFLPASHMFEEFPSDPFVRRNEIQIEAPAGSAIIFDAMVYHRGAPNRSKAIRRAVNNLYTVPLVQQQFDFAKMLNGRYSDDPELFKLLGYRWRPADSVKEWRERHIRQHES
jgi:ectoine hydroxylase-related dioxygenase (phytanoyl-CoA dioxygenase family)